MSSKVTMDIRNAANRIYFKGTKSDRLKTLGIIQDINSFIVSLWQALQIHKPGLVLEPAYPRYVLDIEDANILRSNRPAPEIPEEIITWNIVRRTPGSLDHDPFARTKEIRPRTREELVYEPSEDMDPLEPEVHFGPGEISPKKEHGRVVGMQVKGQFFDNLIQFDIWSKNNKTAEMLAEYLENFMDDFRGMFIELGVTKMHFHSRVRDEVILNWRNGLVNRSLLYYVRTERVKADPVREIKVIHVEAELLNFLDKVVETGVEEFLSEGRDQIVKKWVQKNRSTMLVDN